MFRSYRNYDVDQVSLETGLDTSVDPVTGEVLPSLTQQQFKEEADINELVRRFGITGQLPNKQREPLVGDFTGVTDFQSAVNAVLAATESFDALPALVRDKFGNDPQQLHDFLSDDKNRDEAMSLGLIPKPPERTRDVVQAVDELAARLAPAPVAK